MNNSLHDKAVAALTDRSLWEQKQRIYYQMRHDGLRRKKKPYPGCSDLHYPLIDQQLTKAKPFYKNQAYTSDRLAMFTSMQTNPQAKNFASACSDYFDWHLKQKTNFAAELLTNTDHMCLKGIAVMKVRWDVIEQKLCYDAIDPFYLIVPKGTEKLEDADFFVHVKQETVLSYKRKRMYIQDEALIAQVKGGQSGSGQSDIYEQEKQQREGLTYSKDPDIIIIWEMWVKDGNGWTIHTYSPNCPSKPLRKAHKCPYRWNGKPFCPFVKFEFEVKDKGWYSPRGLAEKLAPYESWLCKMWNGKSDAMDFYNRPMFTGENLRNTANLRFLPGEVLDGNIKPIQFPEPPISFSEEMMQTRQIAESLVASPDAALPSEDNKHEQPTATQINYQQQLATIGIDLNGWIYRLSLGELYWKSWALLVMYQKEELSYIVSNDLKSLPQEALSQAYHIMPDGSPDQWNRQARQQKGQQRFGMFRNDPHINQDELYKSVLEDDDPRLVKRLLLPSGVAEGKEAEDEAMEIIILMAGYPAQVEPNENHVLRIGIIVGKLEQLGVTKAPVDPAAMERLHGHLAAHLQMLMQQNPAMARQIEKKLAMMEKGQTNPMDNSKGMNTRGAAPLNGAPPAEQPPNGQPQALSA